MAFYLNLKQWFGRGDQVDDSSSGFSIVAAASANPNLVKQGPGQITGIHAINQVAALRYLKFYDTNVAPVAGVGTPVRRYAIPGNITGAGFIYVPRPGLKFTAGIAFTLVAGTGLDADTTACVLGDVILTIEFI